VYNEFFLALEGTIVRGAYALKTQPFSFSGEVRSIGYYHHPFSEGIVDRAYSTLGLQLLRDALRRQPALFALGMGSYDRPLPKMLVALKWFHCLVPFHFRVVRPARFFRGMRGLRRTPARRLLMDVAALSGAGAVGLTAMQSWRRRSGRGSGLAVETVERFGPWADALWEQCHPEYAMAALRDASTLNVLFPPGNPRFRRLRISENGDTIGWAVLGERDQKAHPQTGDLRVGVIVDVWGRQADAEPIVAAAAETLAASGIDLMTSNQAHAAWSRALTRAGFLEGPSNFIFAIPKIIADRLQPLDARVLRAHLTRADGDGLYQYA
jgi:hypothetical protein